MKRLLYLFGLFAIIALFASCSNDDISNGIKTPQYMSETKDSKIEVYVKGERAQKNKTRSFMEYGCDVNGNMWPQKPKTVTDEEVKEVLAYIANNPNKNVSLPDYTRYFVQHVGGANNMYSYKDWNGALHTGINGTAGFENLQILENTGYWTHVNNFNAGKCDNQATNNSALMTDGFNGIKAMAEYASSWVEAYRVYYYNGFYYIGLDFSAVKGDGKIPADGIYDDWVVKIIPENNINGDDSGDDNGDNNGDKPIIINKGEVEFDIHQQEHKDWNEIKTSIHLRDSVNVRVLIPIPAEYVAAPDDFDIRAGLDYTKIEEKRNIKYTIANQEFEVEVIIKHQIEGIEILINGTECKDALKVAREKYDDGITFEIHNYIYDFVAIEDIWKWLKVTECLQTSLEKWPKNGDICTHTYGQVSSAYYMNELISYDQKVE